MSQRALILAIAALLVIPAGAVAIHTIPTAAPLKASATGGTVTIQRDAYGVPHVYADTAYDLFFGNGYVMAQDRLFQMDVLRHVGRGQAAEMLGPAQLPLDIAARRDLYTEAERTQQWLGLPAEQRTALIGFADGVNAWINETRADPTKLTAEEYAVANPPSLWIPEDTVAIADYLLSVFGVGSGDQELSNAQLLLQLSHTVQGPEVEKAFHDLVPMYDTSTYSTIAANEGTFNAPERPLAFGDIPAAQWAATWAAANATPFGDIKCLADSNGVKGDCKGSFSNLAQSTVDAGMPLKWGSNAATFSASISRNGKPMLLGGPQMAYYNPMIPYEVGLHGAGYDAVGMGVGGAPGVIIGRAEHYSWTVTSGDGDQVDVVAEKLVPGNPRQYYDGSTVTNMDCREEVHHGIPSAIDQTPPVIATQEVCRTKDGPVFAINEPAGYAFVRQATTRNDELHSGLMWLTLGQESTLAGFAAHMEQFRFTFNFNYADDSGNIAYFHWGGFPTRAPGYDARLPRVAGMWDWQGIKTGSQLPHIVNPAKGYTVNWNNLPEQGFPSGAAREQWGSVHRVELFDRTIQKMLAASPDHKLGADELRWINENISTQNPFAYKIAPYVIGAAEHDSDPQVQAAVNELRAWRDADYTWQDDGHCDKILRKLPAPGAPDCKYVYAGQQIYEAWRAKMQDALMQDELGAFTQELNFDPPTSSDPHAADAGRNDNKETPLLNSYLGRNQHDWCAPESCADLTLSVLKDTLVNLSARYNTTDVTQWHEPIHRIKFSALSGGPAWSIPMVNRPSFNHLYDWGDGTAMSVLPPGTNQNWKPLDFLRFEADGTLPDAHKNDQLVLYANFQYKPASMTPQGVESTTVLHTGNLVASGPI